MPAVLSNCKCIVFDLDGTIYFGSQLADRANEVITRAREICSHIFFITNNSAKTREQIFDKLVALGIDVQQQEIITSSYVIAKYLEENQYRQVYSIGTPDLQNEIQHRGINPNSTSPQAIVVGYNPDFKLSDLNPLANIKLQNYKLIVANRDRSYPTNNGYILPGAGPIVAAVEALLDKQADAIIGKPNPTMLHIMLKDLPISPQNIYVVGDNYNSDIKMAQAYGANGILITKKDCANCLCIKQLADLLVMLHD